MDEGFTIGRQNTYMDVFKQKFAQLHLIGRGDGCEIMLQEIKANEFFFVEVGDDDELMEFFYILEGKLEIVMGEDLEILYQYDYFYANHLKQTIQCKTIADSKLLYFSSKPVFHFLSETLRDLTALVEKVEVKDMYTHSHIKRVKDYSVRIGTKLNLSKEMNENIAFAAVYHDVGKVEIPDEILKKPGKLTKEEFDYIIEHPIIGEELVNGTYFKNIGKIIRQHHERLDGSGYPDQLKDEEIAYEAKIISVSDTYDAMTTDRPYRKGLSPEVAVLELRSLVDKHYDKKIVETLIGILKEDGVLDPDF